MCFQPFVLAARPQSLVVINTFYFMLINNPQISVLLLRVGKSASYLHCANIISNVESYDDGGKK